MSDKMQTLDPRIGGSSPIGATHVCHSVRVLEQTLVTVVSVDSLHSEYKWVPVRALFECISGKPQASFSSEACMLH